MDNDIKCRPTKDILEQIDFYKTEGKRFEELSNKFPNDFDYKRELYGMYSKVFALEWVLVEGIDLGFGKGI